MVQNPPLSGPVSGGWAGRRPGAVWRVGCGQTRCYRVWAGAPTLGIGGLRADRGRDASDARDASKAGRARDASDARDSSKARHARDARDANNARSAAGVRR